jgi:hypothetical protein
MVQGGLHWYGVVLVTGSIAFTGGGEKNVTGPMLAGTNSSADLFGINVNILYCSNAVYDNSHYLPLNPQVGRVVFMRDQVLIYWKGIDPSIEFLKSRHYIVWRTPG